MTEPSSSRKPALSPWVAALAAAVVAPVMVAAGLVLLVAVILPIAGTQQPIADGLVLCVWVLVLGPAFVGLLGAFSRFVNLARSQKGGPLVPWQAAYGLAALFLAASLYTLGFWLVAQAAGEQGPDFGGLFAMVLGSLEMGAMALLLRRRQRRSS